MIAWDTIILVLDRAHKIAVEAKRRGLVSPDEMSLGPNGEIVFELQEGDLTTLCTIWEDGESEVIRFRGAKLVEREVMQC